MDKAQYQEIAIYRRVRKPGLLLQASDPVIVTTIVDRIQAAIDGAEKTPIPAVSTLFSDVFKERPWYLVEQERELTETLAAGYKPNKGHGG